MDTCGLFKIINKKEQQVNELPSKADELFVTLFYLGKVKYAPGTFGSLTALLVLFLPVYSIWYVSLFLSIILFISAYKPVKRYENKFGSDHQSIIIDEVIGMLICLSNPLLNINFEWIALSFVVFRLMDILKPFPLSWINKKEGAFFAIFDDFVAGVFTLVIVHILQLGIGIYTFYNQFN